MSLAFERPNPLEVLDAVITDLRASGDTGHVENLLQAREEIAALTARDRQATAVFGCMLRAVNDCQGSAAYVGRYGLGWIRSWAKALHVAGFKPNNPDARDIANGLKIIGSAL
jgi:hypothetical protein